MSGIGDRLLRILVADPRSQRALDETILDVQAELAEAQHPVARLRWRLRSAIAILRVSVRVLPFELKAVVSDGWTLRLAMWTAVLMLPVAGQALAPIIQNHDLPGWTRVWLTGALLPSALAMVVPISSFVAALWSRRPAGSPVLVAVAAAAVTLAVIQVMPVTNQAFRIVAFTAMGGNPSDGTPARGLRELTLGELTRTAVATHSPSRTAGNARRVILERTGLVAAAGSFTLLGTLLARRARLDPTRRRARRHRP
jgi:hypothetical protein